MLDKRLPYFNIIMSCPAKTVAGLSPTALPEGFTFRLYRPGDMARWAEIEHSVDEFPTAEAAGEYFSSHYLPYEDEMEERCCFLLDREGRYAATASAWHFEAGRRRWAALNWVAVTPGCQGLGLGRAIVTRALSLFPALEPGADVWLHTQTWSHKAVELYLSLGFRPLKREAMAHYNNDFPQAAAAMEPYMTPRMFRIFTQEAL